ncbi:PREDICTED: ribosome biogenesis protein slx9-like [Acropora digitifera]|uniref:ribosome biogenesis protein slx9-like n=1 Tax=Acropora digitifera TaxID=70779 RepID=UPI00077A4975|nr:PREDICTED: ribosome biogenesis protein slx9-like [Acropora digitifera]
MDLLSSDMGDSQCAISLDSKTAMATYVLLSAALFDTGPSVTTETPVKETEKPKQSKKDKRKERHDNFLKKLHAGRKLDEEQKKAKKRAQTPIVGDLEPLLSALSTIKIPEINRDQKKANNSAETGKRPKGNKMSRKARQALQAREVAHFQKVLQHPAYQANPLAAISEHIKTAIQRENGNQT